MKEKIHNIDATERSTELFSAIIESLPDAILAVDRQKVVIVANSVFHNVFTSVPLTVSGRPLSHVLETLSADVASESLLDDIAHAMAHADEETTPPLLQAHCGNVYEIHCKPIMLLGNFSGYLLTFRDITRRMKLEADLAESEQMFRSLADDAPSGIFFYQESILYANQTFCEISGYPLEEIVGALPEKFFAESDRAIINENVERRLRGEQYKKNYRTINALHKDGSIRQFRIISTTVQYKGKPAGLVNAMDISDLVLFQKKLRESELMFREMFEAHSAVMLLVDPTNGNIFDANTAATDFYGLGRETLTGLNICNITDTTLMDSCRVRMGQVMRGEQRSFISKHVRLGGEIRDVEAHVTPIRTPEGKQLLFAIIHDITDRTRFEEQLRSLNTQLEYRVEEETTKRLRHEEVLIEKSRMAAMGEMIGAIAHQWRQPLNALGLLIQDLEDAWLHEELNEKYLIENVAKSMDHIKFMSGTIDDFRNFFKPNKEKSHFDVKLIMQDVLKIVQSRIANLSLFLCIDCCCDREKRRVENEIYFQNCPTHIMTVYGYPNEFRQVILNLITNALDALEDALAQKKVREKSGELEILISQQETDILIHIEDNAGGIPEAVFPKIFDPYFTTKPEGKGTGIGLYMSKMIVERNMDGSLRASNTEKGARFTVTLPRSHKQ